MPIEKFNKSIEDAKIISTIIRRCQMELMTDLYKKGHCKEFCDFMTPEMIIKKTKDRNIFIYKKEKKKNNNEIIGCIGFKTINQPTPNTGEVKLFFVNPDYHRQGIATKLFNHIQNIAKEMKLTKLRVFSSLYADKFYEKMGFISKGKVIRKNNEISPWTDIYMEKEI